MTKSTIDKLSLSKNERLGIYLLLILFAGFIIIPYKFSQPKSYNNIIQNNSNSSSTDLDSDLEISYELNDHIATNKLNESKEKSDDSLFVFDPNKLDEISAIRLGISSAVYKRIQNYLSTGAHFKSPEQFGKIYGLSSKQFNLLRPFIKITNESLIQTKTKSIQPEVITTIDINNCNSVDLLPLPGIGEGLSNRIIKYRNLLGGFHKIEQLKEVYGITDSLFLLIKDHLLINKQLIKLNLSNMKFNELQKHPYIGYKMAKLMSAYIKLHPEATNQEIINNLPSNSLEINKSILPYL